MANFELVIGDKNYSSWSLRPWLVLEHFEIPFSERLVELYEKTTKQNILAHSQAGLVPVLHHGDITVWDSLAICEYLAEVCAPKRLWPKDAAARAHARSVCCEMHAGFRAMRQHYSMNIRHRGGKTVPAEVTADVERIQQIWRACRNRHTDDGPYLFGDFSIADAFYGPVVFRFRSYGVALDGICGAYVETMLAHAAMQKWEQAAKAETHVVRQG